MRSTLRVAVILAALGAAAWIGARVMYYDIGRELPRKLQAAQERGDKPAEARIRWQLGKDLCERRGRCAEAVPHLEKSVEQFESLGSASALIEAEQGLANAYERLGRPDDAERIRKRLAIQQPAR